MILEILSNDFRNLDVCTVIEATFGSDTFFNIDVIFTEIESPDSRGVCVHDFLEIRDGRLWYTVQPP